MTNNLLSGNFNCLLFVDCFQLETHERLARVFNNAKIDGNVPDSQARCGTILEPLEKSPFNPLFGKICTELELKSLPGTHTHTRTIYENS